MTDFTSSSRWQRAVCCMHSESRAVEPWHDHGVAHSTSRCASLKLEEHFVLEKNFCPLASTATCRITAHSCFMRTVEVTILNRPRQYACHVHNSRRDPNAAQGSTKTIYGGADGWQPKSPPTASGRGNQPAGDYRSPTAVARAQ